MEDNWKHRSARMRCGTCMFFVEKIPSVPVTAVPGFGRCRERSPTMRGWPAVFADDWCGAHKLDENKIGPPEPDIEEMIRG